jgi:hypothetical protein
MVRHTPAGVICANTGNANAPKTIATIDLYIRTPRSKD